MKNKNSFERYRIPPDFSFVDLHQQSSMLYDKNSQVIATCLCCDKDKKSRQVPFCSGISSLSQLGEEIPIYFYYLRAISVFIIFLILSKFGGYQFCNFIEGNNCKVLFTSIEIPEFGKLQFPVGYQQRNEVLNFIEFMIFVIAIMILKLFIKIKKYRIKLLTNNLISNRTLKLINVHKRSTKREIMQKLKPFQVQVILTFKVKKLQQSIRELNKLLKKKQIKDKTKDCSYITQKLPEIDQSIREQRQNLKKINKQFKQSSNRLSIVFVIFNSVEQKRDALSKLQTSLISRLFYKLCTCCSETSIRNQSFTVKPADEPNDMVWRNIENPYLRTKFRRILSLALCIVLLIFGVVSEYLFNDFFKENLFWEPIIKAFIVLSLNFIIMILLEFTTEKMEYYQSHTERHLTLVKKLTTFLFINISLSPFIGYYFGLINLENPDTISESELFQKFTFSIVFLTLGNIFKPVPVWLSIGRLIKYLNKQAQKKKGKRSFLTQIEANIEFEPDQFPISTFYSLSLSSLLMVCFFFNMFQIILIIELLAVLLGFWVSKRMLLRICKSPVGLARKISNLAQSLLRFFILVYWFGNTVLFYIAMPRQQRSQTNLLEYIFRNVYSDISFGVTIFCTIFMEFIVSAISKRISRRNVNCQSDSLYSKLNSEKQLKTAESVLQQQYDSYSNSNLHRQLQQQCKKFLKQSKILEN